MQEVERLRGQLEESSHKLQELISVNQQLDADCCQLITEKRVLQMRLGAIEDASLNDSCDDAKVWMIDDDDDDYSCLLYTSDAADE